MTLSIVMTIAIVMTMPGDHAHQLRCLRKVSKGETTTKPAQRGNASGTHHGRSPGRKPSQLRTVSAHKARRQNNVRHFGCWHPPHGASGGCVMFLEGAPETLQGDGRCMQHRTTENRVSQSVTPSGEQTPSEAAQALK